MRISFGIGGVACLVGIMTTAACNGEDVVAVPETECASGLRWVADWGSERMHPGRDCITCHAGYDAPRFVVAGTVYADAHQPDECLGVPDVTVEIVDADGRVHVLTTNASGNFFLQGVEVAAPYTARVIGEAGERTTMTPHAVLNCGRCHTASGSEGAPGRIVVP